MFGKLPDGGRQCLTTPDREAGAANAASKHHVLTEGQSIPLATRVTAANVNEVTQLLSLVDAVPPVGGKPGHPRRRPERLYTDRAYDSEPVRQELRRRGIEPWIPKQRAPHGSGLGVFRWVAERMVSWLHGFRKLRLRTDWLGEVQDVLLTLASCVICFRFL